MSKNFEAKIDEKWDKSILIYGQEDERTWKEACISIEKGTMILGVLEDYIEFNEKEWLNYVKAVNKGFELLRDTLLKDVCLDKDKLKKLEIENELLKEDICKYRRMIVLKENKKHV